MKFRIELVWEDQGAATSSSIYLTSDGRILLQGDPISSEERQQFSLPDEGAIIAVDRTMIRAIKDML